RRHTRFSRDWSSDVCSSDLAAIIASAKKAGIPIAVDPKKRNFFSYKEVDLFKPNLKELREGSKLDVDAGDIASIRKAVEFLEERSEERRVGRECGYREAMNK